MARLHMRGSDNNNYYEGGLGIDVEGCLDSRDTNHGTLELAYALYHHQHVSARGVKARSPRAVTASITMSTGCKLHPHVIYEHPNNGWDRKAPSQT